MPSWNSLYLTVRNTFDLEQTGRFRHLNWTASCQQRTLKAQCKTGLCRKMARRGSEGIPNRAWLRLDRNPEVTRQRATARGFCLMLSSASAELRTSWP